jgi:alanine-glyoxylate transaminase/serine-glyoxylate transaminase/serine-pyruvate transaminase
MTRAPLSPPTRLLCGPGPSNPDPRVLAAQQRPIVGHLDPVFHEALTDLAALLSEVWRRPDGMSIALSATGTSGMEAGLAALLEPGDEVIVGVCGFFGARIAEIAGRYGARVIEVPAPFGEAVPNERLLAELGRHPGARMVAVVHAETSTGVAHPLAELAAAMAGSDALLFADCVTSLSGMELEAGGWGVDYAYSCSQKCLGAPPGLAPVSLSERALDRIAERRAPVPYSFDFELLRRYWIERPATYHHTVPVLSYYALHEAVRLALEEGLEQRFARHARAGAHLQTALRERGFELLAEPEHQLPQLTAVRVPEGVDGRAVQAELLERHGIEIGGGLGPKAPPIWRLGLMGTNATVETADRLLEAFDSVAARPRSASMAGGR